MCITATLLARPAPPVVAPRRPSWTPPSASWPSSPSCWEGRPGSATGAPWTGRSSCPAPPAPPAALWKGREGASPRPPSAPRTGSGGTPPPTASPRQIRYHQTFGRSTLCTRPKPHSPLTVTFQECESEKSYRSFPRPSPPPCRRQGSTSILLERGLEGDITSIVRLDSQQPPAILFSRDIQVETSQD